jgi:hypothetical protein
MAYQELTVGPNWAAAGRYTAAGVKAVAFSANQNAKSLFFTITATDTAPTQPLPRAVRVPPGVVHSMELTDGERLWLACTVTQTIGIEVVDA